MKKRKVHYLINNKPLCGKIKTVQDTASLKWFNGMIHKCNTCDKLLFKKIAYEKI